MPIMLSLLAADLDDESLQKLTRQLCQDLRDEAGIESSLAKQPAEPGTRGDIEIIGQILIKAVGAGGAIVALINVLKAYAQRKPVLVVKLQTKKGHKIEIKADDLRGDNMAKLIETVNRVLGEMEFKGEKDEEPECPGRVDDQKRIEGKE